MTFCYRTHDGYAYPHEVRLTDREQTVLEALRTPDLMQRLRCSDNSRLLVFEKWADYPWLLGYHDPETEAIAVRRDMLCDLLTARHAFLHELTHLLLTRAGGESKHDFSFFMLEAILKIRAHGASYAERTIRCYSARDFLGHENADTLDRWGVRAFEIFRDTVPTLLEMAQCVETVEECADALLTHCPVDSL